MRTTLSIDPDVAKRLKEEQHRTRRTFKEVVNDALRKGLAVGAKPAPKQKRFRVEAHHCGFRAGVDVARLNQLYDQLEVDELALEARARAR